MYFKKLIVLFNLTLLNNAYAADEGWITANSRTKKSNQVYRSTKTLPQIISTFNAAPSQAKPAIPKIIKPKQPSPPLHSAAQNDNIAKLDELIKQGVSISSLDQYGATALHWAAREGNVQAIKILLKHQDALKCLSLQDNSGKTPFHYAATSKSNAINILLTKVPENSTEFLEQRDQQGSTALAWASSSGRFGAIQALVERGANVNSQDHFRGRTPLHWVLRMRKGSPEKGGKMISTNIARKIIPYLLEHKADPTITDNQDRTPYDWTNRKTFEVERAIFNKYMSLPTKNNLS